MDFWTAVQTCFRKYVDFGGRARRSEFWYFWLFLILGSVVAAILDATLGYDMAEGGGPVGGVFSLATLLPLLAATARRLHDTDHSGWWQAGGFGAAAVAGVAIAFAAFGGGTMAGGAAMLLAAAAGIAALGLTILVLVWLVSAGTRGPNRFGPDPMGPPVLVQPYGAPPPGPGGGNPWR